MTISTDRKMPSIARKHSCNLRRLDFQQEQGLMSCLPLAQNLIEIERGLTTSSTAIFVPFTTQELFQSGREALYYGLNALSNNLIMVDRKLLKNPNGLILDTPGSVKSFSAKREIANAFLVTDDDIIISNPEAKYSPLVERLGGQVIKGLWAKIPADGHTTLTKPYLAGQSEDGKNIWKDEKTTVINRELKSMVEFYKKDLVPKYDIPEL